MVTPLEILLVDDNPGDVLLFLNEFKETNIPAKFHIVWNGEEALRFLNQEDEYVDVSKPDLLVMDLYLPKKDGIEVLKDVGKHEHLRNIPVVILSSISEQKHKIEKCQLLHHIFITKPPNLEEYKNVMNTIAKFWHSLNK